MESDEQIRPHESVEASPTDDKSTPDQNHVFQEFEGGGEEPVAPRSKLRLFAILVALNVCSTKHSPTFTSQSVHLTIPSYPCS